jgi:IS605 OrfB family transposase
MRYTTFRYALDPTPAQGEMLARYAGASRFAYNQSLRLVTDALEKKSSNPTAVPWSGFDLINAFNAWKRSEAAGRSFVVSPDGTITKKVTGLVWRHEISAQVFVEAAVDLGRALAAYEQGRVAKAKGRRVGFPRRKRKGRCHESFRITNIRRSFLHEVSSQLVKTHDRLCLEDLAVANLLGNRQLARALSDAAWTELARQLGYKAAWYGAELVVSDRWLPSTRTCSKCGLVGPPMTLGERVFSCHGCGLVADRDCNAAANLAAWAEAANMAAA